ncbi:hypothetical protein [Nonomuraea africana]|uniref:Uncharacterized protein n=1 Tax=Nonomuraea africana TaxID=46171 RepID=A0ABR9KAS6_9ACTN|nr:hypothetical protein [Nonomuraea africana]MBE1559116.1 hypothetical protein [Nonomuraea africana]
MDIRFGTRSNPGLRGRPPAGAAAAAADVVVVVGAAGGRQQSAFGIADVLCAPNQHHHDQKAQ